MTATAFTGLRARLTDSVNDSDADAILDALRDAMKTTKTGWGTCRGCGKRVEVEVRDATAAVRAAEALLQQLEGKPGTQTEQDTGPSVVIQRTVATGQQQDTTAEGVAPALTERP